MKKIRKIKRLQFEIMSGIKGYQNGKGFLTKNPFYGCDIQRIKNEIKKAREIYKELFRYGFVPSWCLSQAGDCNTAEVFEKIKNGEIEPIPNYNEMKELKIT